MNRAGAIEQHIEQVCLFADDTSGATSKGMLLRLDEMNEVRAVLLAGLERLDEAAERATDILCRARLREESRCPECDRGFSVDEWQDRHSRVGDGADVHAMCCTLVICVAARP